MTHAMAASKKPLISTATTELATDIHADLLARINSEQRPASYLLIDSTSQTLQLCAGGQVLQSFCISTAEHGLGGQSGSYKTPPGLHQITQIIGEGAVSGLLFKGRIAQPLCAVIEPRAISTGIDTVTSRILRLGGLQPGVNQGEGCDSSSRFIYIHGTAEEGLLGQPVSHGCIRMANADVIALTPQVQTQSLVFIY